MAPDEWKAVLARRALLLQQTELMGLRLPWLADSNLIPDDAIAPPAAHDVHLAAFSLAAWMLLELLRVAPEVNRALQWDLAFERFEVEPRLRESVIRAVLSPASRHAPGLFAIAEIISVVPKVASRAGLQRDRWRHSAARTIALGTKLASDNTAVQVLLRSYLSGSSESERYEGVRVLNPACLRLDEAIGLTTSTPIERLLEAARRAAARHGHSYRATCVALQAAVHLGPMERAPRSFFGAIWASFAGAADRLVFPKFDPVQQCVPRDAGPDPAYEATLDEIAEHRRNAVDATASRPYSKAVAKIFEALLTHRSSETSSHPVNVDVGRP